MATSVEKLARLLWAVVFTLGLVSSVDAATYTPPASNRASIALSGSWRFFKADVGGAEASGFDDSTWPTVTVPHTWNSIDGQDGPDIGGDPSGRSYYRGVGWYRRHINVPAAYAGRKLFLQFDGANIVADVWVNGTYVGRHLGGFTIFRFDVTSLLNLAAGNDNVIAVKVDNSNSVQIAPLAGDFTFFGGIYRDVSLVVTDALAADMLDYGSPAVYLSQTNVTPAQATVAIKTLVRNANAVAATMTVKSIVVDAAGNIVQTAKTQATMTANSARTVVQNVSIAAPHLWDGVADPYLYSVYVEIHEGTDTGPVRDLVPAQPLGLRYYSLDPNLGFWLNGHYQDLHGVNRHQDRLNKGWAISRADHDEDMSLIKEIGATAIRLAHYPQAQYFYSLADTNGVIVWAELPVLNGVGDQAFTVNAKQQLTELIRQSYNHPAIIFWGLANEVLINPTPDPYPVLTDLEALAKQEDPYRLTTLAHCCGSDTGPTTDITNTVGFNRYYGWYESTYSYIGPWADQTHAASPSKPFSVSEYGAGASIFLHAQNPPLSLSNHTEEYQALLHEAYWLALKTRRYVWGKFVWNMFDFASDNRTEGDTNGRNDKGLVTFDRQTRKDAFYWYKANWTTAPMVYVTSRRWTQRTAATTEVKIYSNADSVELRVNGISIGTLTALARPDRIFIWSNIVLNNGANTVQAIGRTGTTTVVDTVNWNLGTPKVIISSPLNGDAFVAPANITIAATPADNSLVKVEFFSGATKLGEDTNGADGWSLPWSNVPRGSYVLTAKSTDTAGASTISPEVRVTVNSSGNALPAVSITTPLDNTVVTTGSNVTLVASASDPDGSVERVSFYQGSTKLGDDNVGSDGWSLTLWNLPSGTYSFTAKATDNLGATATSAPIALIVNAPPTVSLAAPANGATFTAPANITITANAADTDGSVTKVAFFQGATKLGEDTNGSDGWTFSWTNVPIGSYTLVAIATDNRLTNTTSVSIGITVAAASNQPPTVATPASAAPATVTGTTTTLSVLGADDGGEPNLIYTWTTTGMPPAPVTFSANGTNAAKSAVASFARAGAYTFLVTIQDAAGRTVTSSVGVSVNQTITAVSVSPSAATVPIGGTTQFAASATDQFAIAMSTQPSFAWSASGGGSISGGGLFTAGLAPGTGFTVTATAAGRSGSAAVTIVSAGGFSANVNFQPATAPPYAGYVIDAGAVFGARGNGLTYGWSQDATAMARDRDSAASPDQRYDTLVHMGTLTWEIAVPNGTYSVHAVVGDPGYPDINSKLTVEGVLTIDGTTSSSNPWLQGTTTVTVSDGRLTIGNQAGSYNKICFLEISSTGSTNQPPTVSIVSPANGATMSTPATVSITATAADADGSVAKVEFFDSSTKLGEDTNGSDGWTFVWPNVAAGNHVLTARATDNAGAATTSSSVTITVTAPLSMRIDVGGGGNFTDSAGNVWLSDRYASGGTTSSKPDPIGNTVDDDLFRTYRYGTFSYDIPVANGTYDVTLEFMEPWWTAPGLRLFTVSAEGAPRLVNVDLFSLGGKFNAVERTFSVVVTDGVLNIGFTSVVDNAIVSAIAIAQR